jgi:hypothetical protein
MFAVQRAANITDNTPQIEEKNHRHHGIKMSCRTVARRACLFNFWLLARNLNPECLCDLCGSSEAGAESMSKELSSSPQYIVFC